MAVFKSSDAAVYGAWGRSQSVIPQFHSAFLTRRPLKLLLPFLKGRVNPQSEVDRSTREFSSTLWTWSTQAKKRLEGDSS